jgi:uncharacterized protein YjiS (DUF1127 family)
MESAVSKHDLEFLTLNYRRLIPADYSPLRQLVNERAKALRTEFLRELWRQITSWYQQRVALAQLRALDDAALKDIGLHRSGIEAAVLGPRPGTAPRQPRHFPQKPHLWLQRTG